jgi:hypothetical protein
MKMKLRTLWVITALLLVTCGFGCVTKREADARARAAFLEGQNRALMTRSTMQGPNVTFIGPVRNRMIPWMTGMTLAQAVIAADYTGPQDPKLIIIKRQDEEIPVNPQHLLGGVDVPVVAGDVIEIQ